MTVTTFFSITKNFAESDDEFEATELDDKLNDQVLMNV